MKKSGLIIMICCLTYSCIQNNDLQGKGTSKKISKATVRQAGIKEDQQEIRQQPYVKVGKYADGSAMTDLKCDGVVYKKIGNEYFKKSFTGAVQADWFFSGKETPVQSRAALKKLLNLPIPDKTLNKKTFLISGDLFSNSLNVAGNTRVTSGTLKLDPSVTSSNPDGANILKITTNNNTFTNVVFDGNQFGFNKNVSTRCVNLAGENNTFNNCTFKGASINGIRIYGKGHRFNNCVFTENGGSGIEIISATDIQFNNCYIFKNGGGFKKIKQSITAVDHEFSGFGVAVRYRSSNIHFNNSHFYLNARDGLNVNQGSHDVYINNCNVYGNDDGGITVASDLIKSGQPGDGEDCYNIYIKNSRTSNNYSAGIAVYAPASNVKIIDCKSFNNNRVAGDQSVQSSYYNGIYIASGSSKVLIEKTTCYDDGKDYIAGKNSNGIISIKNWTTGKLKERNKFSLYSGVDGKFKGYVEIVSETPNTVTLKSLPFNSVPVNTINSGDQLSLKTQHNGVFIDNNCSGYCNVKGYGHKIGASGDSFSGLLVFQGITSSGNSGVAIDGKKITGNLISNPNFNLDVSSWAFNTPEGTALRDNATGRSLSSLKLEASNQPVFSDCTAYKADVLNKSRRSYLHFAGWVKAKGKASIQLMVSPDQNTPFFFKTDLYTGNGKWQYLDCWTFVPPNTQGIICRLVAEAHSSANFDDLLLEVVQP